MTKARDIANLAANAVNLANNTISSGTINTSAVNDSTINGPRYTQDDEGTITGGTLNINYNDGPFFRAQVGAAITTINVTNWPASGTLGHIKLMLVNPGAFSITFPASWSFVKSDLTLSNFAGLNLTLPASGVVFMDLITQNAGTNVYVTIGKN